jgi:hypothetical protein
LEGKILNEMSTTADINSLFAPFSQKPRSMKVLKAYQSLVFKRVSLNKLTVTLLSVCLAVVSATKTVEAATLEVVASNLDNPRRITFGTDGALYVAEAGKGGGRYGKIHYRT